MWWLCLKWKFKWSDVQCLHSFVFFTFRSFRDGLYTMNWFSRPRNIWDRYFVILPRSIWLKLAFLSAGLEYFAIITKNENLNFELQVIELKPEWLVEIAPHYYQLKDVEDCMFSLSLSLSLCEVGTMYLPLLPSTLRILFRAFDWIASPYILMFLGIKRMIKLGCPMHTRPAD